MGRKKVKKSIHVLDFNCKDPLKYFERCAKCAKEGRCPDRARLIALLLGRKKLDYTKK